MSHAQRLPLTPEQADLFDGVALTPHLPSDQLHELADQLGVTIPELDNYRDERKWLRAWLLERPGT